MTVVFSKSFVDRKFADRDVDEIYSIVKTLARQRQLSERCEAFLRFRGWYCTNGIYQYYEHASTQTIELTVIMFENYGLNEISQRYRDGLRTWQRPNFCRELEGWIYANGEYLDTLAYDLIVPEKTLLYPLNATQT